MKVRDEVEKAYELAISAREKSYSPYSHFAVGSTIKVAGKENYYSGANIENASYGATVCAERVAIWNAVSSEGEGDFEFIVIVTDTDPAIGPCALCLQVMAEFCKPDFEVYFANTKEIHKMVPFKDLLKDPFSSIPK